MQQIWKTVSIRLTEEELRALDYLCEREKTNRHSFLKSLVKGKIDRVLTPGEVSEGEGIPQTGRHRLVYEQATDTFRWVLERGGKSQAVLSKAVHHSFLENLRLAIDEALQERERVVEEREPGSVPIPSDIEHYEVEE